MHEQRARWGPRFRITYVPVAVLGRPRLRPVRALSRWSRSRSVEFVGHANECRTYRRAAVRPSRRSGRSVSCTPPVPIARARSRSPADAFGLKGVGSMSSGCQEPSPSMPLFRVVRATEEFRRGRAAREPLAVEVDLEMLSIECRTVSGALRNGSPTVRSSSSRTFGTGAFTRSSTAARWAIPNNGPSCGGTGAIAGRCSFGRKLRAPRWRLRGPRLAEPARRADPGRPWSFADALAHYSAATDRRPRALRAVGRRGRGDAYRLAVHTPALCGLPRGGAAIRELSLDVGRYRGQNLSQLRPTRESSIRRRAPVSNRPHERFPVAARSRRVVRPATPAPCQPATGCK